MRTYSPVRPHLTSTLHLLRTSMAVSANRSAYDLALRNSEAEIVRKVMKKLEAKINTRDGILAVTIQENRTGRYSSLIYNCARGTLLENYPLEMKNQQRSFVADRFIISYQENLEVPAEPSANQIKEYQDGRVFCCSNLTPYKPIKVMTNNEKLFKDFMAKNGTQEEIFQVTRQINNGPDLSTKYFKLINSGHVQVEADVQLLFKEHSYWNMKCLKHNLFFKINLFSKNQVYNSHHIRELSTSKVDEQVLREFLSIIL